MDEIRAHGLGILLADPIRVPEPEPTEAEYRIRCSRLLKENEALRQFILNHCQRKV